MKIAIGMVVRNLLSASPLTEFLDNRQLWDCQTFLKCISKFLQ